MKLRLCRISFHRNVKIQIDGGVKTRKNGDNLVAIELGNAMSFGKDHWIGALSSSIQDPSIVKKNIEKLENFDTQKRIEWFEDTISGVKLVKIDATLLVDKINGVKDNMDQNPAVTIDSAAELHWK